MAGRDPTREDGVDRLIRRVENLEAVMRDTVIRLQNLDDQLTVLSEAIATTLPVTDARLSRNSPTAAADSPLDSAAGVPADGVADAPPGGVADEPSIAFSDRPTEPLAYRRSSGNRPRASVGMKAQAVPPLPGRIDSNVTTASGERPMEPDSAVEPRREPAVPWHQGDGEEAAHLSLDWEQIIGAQWAEKTGGLLVFLGVAFFLKFAFDRGWIDPVLRIGMGVSAGLALMAGAEAAARKGIRDYAPALSATGLAMSYLSFLAGASLYHLYGIHETVGLLAVVSAIGAGLAVRYNAQSLAVMSALGAYLAPVLLADSTDHGRAGTTFLTYLTVTTAGFAFLSFRRSWRAVHAVAFVAAWMLEAVFLLDRGGTGNRLSDAGYVAILYTIFLITPLALRSRIPAADSVRAPDAATADLLLLLANPPLFFCIAAEMIRQASLPDQEWLAMLAFSLTAIYASIAVFRASTDPLLAGSATALATGFSVIGIAIGFPSRATLAWCAEGVTLVWFGLDRRQPLLRTAGGIITGLALLRLLTVDLPGLGWGVAPVPYANGRFGAIAGTALALGLLSRLYHRFREAAPDRVLPLALWTGACALLGLGVALESPNTGTILWAVLGLIWLLTTRDYPAPLRSSFFGPLLGATLFRSLVVEIAGYRPGPETLPFLNMRFCALASVAGLCIAASVLLKPGDRDEGAMASLLLGSGAMVFFGLGIVLETPIFATLLWIGLAAVWLLTTSGSPSIPRAALFVAFAGVITGRVLLVDAPGFDPNGLALPMLNLRFTVFIALAMLLFLGSAFLRDPSPNRQEDNGIPVSAVLVTSAHLCLLYGLGQEALLAADRLMGTGVDPVFRASARQFVLSALWALYASALVGWGFRRQETGARFAGLLLLGVVVVKLLTIDMANVETIWRVVSFSCIGMLLLAVSLVYHRRRMTI